MKRSIIYKVFGIAALAFAAFGAISCTEKETEVKEQPNFPEKVTINDIVPGTKLAVTFTPNMDWTLSLSDESIRWFEIDDKFDKQSISGEASRLTKRVSILTTSEESFSLRSCEVYLTMGGEKKTIASFTLQAKNRALDVYPAIYSDNGFSFSDGSYVYDTKAMTSDDVVELVWDEIENKFIFPIKVKSNFEWTATWPEWARTDINTDTRIGDVPLLVYGFDSKLPYDATEDVITFKHGDEIFASFKISIPGARDKFKVNIGGYSSLTFDHAAYFRADAGTFSKEPIEGSIFGPKECRVEVLELTENGYVKAEDSWLMVRVSAWDNVSGAPVLQSRSVSVTASRYDANQDRGAMILLLPATAPADLAEIFESGMAQVKAEYAKYAVPVTQLARPSKFFTFDYGISEREFAGLYFKDATSELLPEKNFQFAKGAESWQYELTYCKGIASGKSAVSLTEPYASVEVYDADGNKIAADAIAEHWLNYEQLGDVMYGQVIMNEANLPVVEAVGENGEPILDDNGDPVKLKVEAIDGYVVFKNDLNEVLCIVHCFYVKEKLSDVDIYEEASAEVFMNPEAAAAAGVTAYKITAGPTYQKYIEFEAPIYMLTCTKDDQNFVIKTSKNCEMYTCNEEPKYGPKMVTIDNQIYSDPVVAEIMAEHEKELVEFWEGKANGTIPPEEKEPLAPDTSSYDRSTMGLLKFGATSFIERTYPGYSDFRMKMPEPEVDSETGLPGEPYTVYKEVLLFQTTSSVRFVFICYLDLRDATQGE